jgi:hypothetical protein
VAEGSKDRTNRGDYAVIAPESVSVLLGSSGRDDKWANLVGDRRKGGRVTVREERFLGRGPKLVVGRSAARSLSTFYFLFSFLFRFLF